MSDNEGMRCVLAMQPVYERCRELCELADSTPDYRLAVVDVSDGDDHYDGEAYAKGEVRVISRYRVVKMEDK